MAAIALAAALILASCAGTKPRVEEEQDVVPFPSCRLMVLSDPHLFSKTLFVEDPTYVERTKLDRKLLVESEAILDAALARVVAERPDFLIIPGDLTKDGEEIDHRLMAEKLAAVKAAGIGVYVVPGNHDILNPRAFAFGAKGQHRTPNVTPELFASIYEKAGYGDALRRDPSSLSYVAEPVPGLWLLALDSCEYKGNAKKGSAETGGRLPRERLDWALSVLREARASGKAVIAMEHHGLVEHFPTQGKYFRAFLVDDRERITSSFAAEGLRLAFTGHYHANDASLERFGPSASRGAFLCDVETGSLASYPCPVRTVELGSYRVSYSTWLVDSAQGYPELQDYVRGHEEAAIVDYATSYMRRYGATARDAEILSPALARAMMAHLAGDERRPEGELLPSKGLGPVGLAARLAIGDCVEGFWTDFYPPDNDFSLDLRSGLAAPK